MSGQQFRAQRRKQLDLAILGGCCMAVLFGSLLLVPSGLIVTGLGTDPLHHHDRTVVWFEEFMTSAWTVVVSFLGLASALLISTAFDRSWQQKGRRRSSEVMVVTGVLAWLLGCVNASILVVALVGAFGGFVQPMQVVLLALVSIASFIVGVASYMSVGKITKRVRTKMRRASLRTSRQLLAGLRKDGRPLLAGLTGIGSLSISISLTVLSIHALQPAWTEEVLWHVVGLCALVTTLMGSLLAAVRSVTARILPGSLIPRVLAVMISLLLLGTVSPAFVSIGLGSSPSVAILMAAPTALAVALVWLPLPTARRANWNRFQRLLPGAGIDELSRRALSRSVESIRRTGQR